MSDEFDVDLDGVSVPKPPEAGDGVTAEQRRRLESAPPLEEYVAREVAITQRQIDMGVVTDDPAGRLERTERYARWRWNGYVADEIESL